MPPAALVLDEGTSGSPVRTGIQRAQHWDVFEEGLASFSSDFIKERPEQGEQHREDLFS